MTFLLDAESTEVLTLEAQPEAMAREEEKVSALERMEIDRNPKTKLEIMIDITKIDVHVSFYL